MPHLSSLSLDVTPTTAASCPGVTMDEVTCLPLKEPAEEKGDPEPSETLGAVNEQQQHVTDASSLEADLTTHGGDHREEHEKPDKDTDDSDEEEEDEEEEEEEEPPKEPRVREAPEDIKLEAIPTTMCMHPSRDVMAVGDLDGDIFLYSYSCTEGETRELWSSGHHRKACRGLAFSDDGAQLYSVSKDKSVLLFDVEQGKLVKRIQKAHDMCKANQSARHALTDFTAGDDLRNGSSAIYSLAVIDENLTATGGDDGVVRVWDFRQGTYVMEQLEHTDFVSSMVVGDDKRTLLTTSGDGTLCAFNVRRRRFDVKSEVQDCDLTSIAIVKEGTKVVCGSSEGWLLLFNWGGFGAVSDRFSTRTKSVDCLARVSDNLVCTASMDGIIRAVSLLPNRVLGVVGQHGNDPIEALELTGDGRFLTSCGHDQLVKFWPADELRRRKVNDYRRRVQKNRPLLGLNAKADTAEDFFAGLLEGAPDPTAPPQSSQGGKRRHESDSDDSDDSD